MDTSATTTTDGKLRSWTYTETHAALVGQPCEEIERLYLAKAARNVADATFEVVGHRHTATGRHSVTLRGTRA